MPLLTLDSPSWEVADKMVLLGTMFGRTNGDDCANYEIVTEWCEANLGGISNSNTRDLISAMEIAGANGAPFNLFTAVALMVCVPELADDLDLEMKTAIAWVVADHSVGAAFLIAAYGETLPPELHYKAFSKASKELIPAFIAEHSYSVRHWG
jgi:hypothetical protein